MKTLELGQNFLHNPRIARRIVRLAAGSDDALCVDLGAGKGVITEAAAGLGRRVLAIEKDSRLVRHLEGRFKADLRVQVSCADLLTVGLPSEAFICVSNPPFNLSTQLVRRWMTADHFESGAVIVEREFGRRIAGQFGATKLSLSLGAFLDIDVSNLLNSAEFYPRPRVPVAIMTVCRRETSLIPWSQRHEYWLFVNYLFERSRLTVGESLAPLRLGNITLQLSATPLRSLRVTDVVSLFRTVLAPNTEHRLDRIKAFDMALPAKRRALVTETPTPSPETLAVGAPGAPPDRTDVDETPRVVPSPCHP
jgi:23S rRNA (adenine-N6)-dimethyltransferase